MKKILIVLILTTGYAQTQACDICGCGVGSNYIGILPEFTRHIMGMRYRYSTLQTHLGENGAPTYLTAKEVYQSAELWGGWNITKNIRLMATIPYSFNERRSEDAKGSKQGLGDITVSGYYQLINSKSAKGNNKLLVQSLWIGAGIKLPTGKYDPADKSSGTENTNLFQLGTSSTDILFNAMYDVRLQDAGINVSAAYKINGTNKYDYSYGNKLSTSAQLYYKFRVKNKVLIAPNAGVQYEYAKKDTDNKFSVDISGGNILCGTIGLETAYRKIMLGANFQKPLTQRLANDLVRSGNRAMIHISFTL